MVKDMHVSSDKKGVSVRILMIAPEPFLEPRGTPFSVYHRAKALVTLGYEVDLVTYPIGKQVTLPGLRIYRAPALPFIRKVKIGPSLAKFPLDLCLFLTALWRLCWRRYRYIHTHEEAGVMGVVLAFIFGCKHLYDMHSDLSQQMSNFAFTKSTVLIRCVDMLQKLIVRRADAVIAICPDLEQTVKRLAPGKPVYMIENVAVDEALPPAKESDVALIRQRWKLGTDPVLLYTGTFESYQGIELLLRSVALVRPAFPNARYVLVGGKPEQVEKQRLLAQKLGIAEMVCFVGQRPLEEMPQYMALADILLSPRSEGTNTPLKLYTYLRSGKPILATDIYSHSQILTSHMAMLVPPTQEGLARGALELLNDPELAQHLGAYGQSVAEKNYSWPAFLEKNSHAYSEFTGLTHHELPGLAQKVKQ
jgi:glycosyltransferase involved in cell wall biosynthesis